MADGTTKAIGSVTTGDVVLATDPATGTTKAEPVDDLIIGIGQKSLVDITIDTGKTGPATVTATDNHPFWVVNRHTWVDAGDLHPGDDVRTTDGTSRTVLAVHARTNHQQVNNLTVENLHTYYILAGTTPVLVHNCPLSGPADPSPIDITKTRPLADLVPSSSEQTAAVQQQSVDETVASVGVRRSPIDTVVNAMYHEHVDVTFVFALGVGAVKAARSGVVRRGLQAVGNTARSLWNTAIGRS